MESNGLHDLQKNEVPMSPVCCVRVMKCWVPCTLWHIKNGVPLCENGVQIMFFPLFLDTFKNIEALFNFLSTDKKYVSVDKSILKNILKS